MNITKLLYVYFQPKDLDFVLEPLKEIPFDKLYIKYYDRETAYKILNKSFKTHPEYDALFFHSNDTVIKKKDIEALVKEFKNDSYQILGMSTNLDLTPTGLEKMATSIKTPEFATQIDWLNFGDMEGVFQVGFMGCPFIISREAYLQVPFRGEPHTGFNADLFFSQDCKKLGIPMFVDARIRVTHHRFAGNLLVGRKQPKTEYIKWK